MGIVIALTLHTVWICMHVILQSLEAECHCDVGSRPAGENLESSCGPLKRGDASVTAANGTAPRVPKRCSPLKRGDASVTAIGFALLDQLGLLQPLKRGGATVTMNY